MNQSLLVDDVIKTSIVSCGPWGAYVLSECGHKGFVDAMELTWFPRALSNIQLQVGDELTVIVIGHRGRRADEECFIGSVRMLCPELDPWAPKNQYKEGDICKALVDRSNETWMTVVLRNGALTMVPLSAGSTLGSGELEVHVCIRKVSLEKKKIEATLV